jgi:hypothetical protein
MQFDYLTRFYYEYSGGSVRYPLRHIGRGICITGPVISYPGEVMVTVVFVGHALVVFPKGLFVGQFFERRAALIGAAALIRLSAPSSATPSAANPTTPQTKSHTASQL